jgi:hypothetical protein
MDEPKATLRLYDAASYAWATWEFAEPDDALDLYSFICDHPPLQGTMELSGGPFSFHTVSWGLS